MALAGVTATSRRRRTRGRVGWLAHGCLDFRHDAKFDKLLVKYLVKCVHVTDYVLVEQLEDDQADLQAGFDALYGFLEGIADGLWSERIMPALQVRVANEKTDAFVERIQGLGAGAAGLVDHVADGQLFFHVI